jgi:hypothetical protein
MKSREYSNCKSKSVKVFGDLAVFILINSYRAKLNIQKKITAFSRTGEK